MTNEQKQNKLNQIIDELRIIDLKYGSAVIRILAAKLIVEHELPIWPQLKQQLENLKRIKDQ